MKNCSFWRKCSHFIPNGGSKRGTKPNCSCLGFVQLKAARILPWFNVMPLQLHPYSSNTIQRLIQTYTNFYLYSCFYRSGLILRTRHYVITYALFCSEQVATDFNLSVDPSKQMESIFNVPIIYATRNKQKNPPNFGLKNISRLKKTTTTINNCVCLTCATSFDLIWI